MATISKLKVGQILYDKHKYTMGHTTIRTYGLWEVEVCEIDPNNEFILASWNGNKPQVMYENEVKKLRVKEPEMTKSRF